MVLTLTIWLIKKAPQNRWQIKSQPRWKPRYVVKFSKFLGSEFYARNWVREPPEAEPDARPSPRSRSIPQRSRSQANQDANAALIARYAAEEAAENQSREGVLTC